MEFQDAVARRHSAYMLDDRISDIGVSMDDVVDRIRSIAPAVPSSYNSQSSRVIILSGEEHHAFWGIVKDVIRKKIGDERFAKTERKLNGFDAGAGTILFYEIDGITQKLIDSNLSYAETFPIWAEHGNAMMQFAVWTALYDLGLAANIQHYNPIIDDRVRETFGIPDGYRLVAQIVFGRETVDPTFKDKLPGDEIVSIGRLRE